MPRRRAAAPASSSAAAAASDPEDAEVIAVEEAPRRKGRRKAVPVKRKIDDDVDSDSKRAKLDDEEPLEDEKPAKDKNKAKTKMNKSSTDFQGIDFACKKTSASGKAWNFKISTWNVDGIRAWMGKGGLEYITHENPDILCLQETKCSEAKLPPEIKELNGYHQYWVNGEKEGYAGVGLLTKEKPLSVIRGLSEEFDTEGRIVTAEYNDFYLVCVYVPNSGRGLVTLPKRLEWNKEFRKFVKDLDAKKPVVICGDMNVAHGEIDLANPKTNKKNAGFTPEEREGMTDLLGDGFTDSYRKLYPEETGVYTFWTYMSNSRAKNVGWRLDYAIVSERLMDDVCDNIVRDQVFGSDHCPITLFLAL